MLDDIVDLLADPLTGEPLHWDGSSRQTLTTVSGRRYDVAKQGFVTLFARGRSFPGDTAQMVMERDALLGSGLYSPLADALVETARTILDGQQAPVLIDSGAGTGYYTRAMLEALHAVGQDPRCLAIDISTPAAKRLAKLPGRTGAVVADVWKQWPLMSDTADLITHIFAPRNPSEDARVLRPGGELLVVTPTASHLQELVAAGMAVHVDEQKAARLHAGLGHYLEEVACRPCEWVVTPTARQLQQIIGMGPSSYHSTPQQVEEITEDLAGQSGQVHCAVEIRRYRRSCS